MGGQNVDLHPILPSLCMQEVTHPSVAQSNTVRQSHRCSRGNMGCKYELFLVQILVQMHTPHFRFYHWYLAQAKPGASHCSIIFRRADVSRSDIRLVNRLNRS